MLTKQGQCCILIKGFQTRRVAITHLREQLHPQRDLSDFLYSLQWEPLLDVNSYRKKEAADFPALPALVKALNAKCQTLLQDKDIVRYQEGFKYINLLAQEYMRQAFLELGLVNTLGASIDAQVVKPAQQKLFSKILETLRAAGDLDDKNCLKQLLYPKLTNLPEWLMQEHAIELTLTQRCGAVLADVLQGKIEPLTLLFPNDPQLLGAEHLYQRSLGAQWLNTLLSQSLKMQLKSWRKDRPLRILEIGAGTGSTTQAVLPFLTDYQIEYVFTDIGKTFLDKAKQQFTHTGMRFAILDIEKDPMTQGFAPQQFDLIIAANVLHATKNLHETLEHVRLLLSAKGRLLLMEGIQPQSWLDITFGLLDGWWRFDDDVRKDSPLIGAMQWKALFKDHNFSQSGYIKDSLGQTIFFAQASDVIGKTLPQLPFALIGEADYELNQTLQAQLASLGETCIFYSDVHEIDSETQVQGIIYLRGCALPEFDS